VALPINRQTRRQLLGAIAFGPALMLGQHRSTDVRIEDISYGFEDYTYRTPIKFGGTVVDKVTLLNVDCVVRSGAGKSVKGFGSMPLGNVWAFPSKTMPYEKTLNAMKVLSERIAKLTGSYKEYGHPVDLNHALERVSSNSISLFRSSARLLRQARSKQRFTMRSASCTTAAPIRPTDPT
jgi:hypothetical protein